MGKPRPARVIPRLVLNLGLLGWKVDIPWDNVPRRVLVRDAEGLTNLFGHGNPRAKP